MTSYRMQIVAIGMGYGLAPNLVEAVVIKESAGQTDAFRYEPEFYHTYLEGKPEWSHWVPRRVSSSYGLMQIMFPTAVELGFKGLPEELFIPEVGLEWGCKRLSQMLTLFKHDQRLALAAYNGGPGNARKPDPQSYATAVLKILTTVNTVHA